MKKAFTHKLEQGQIIPLLALGAFALAAMAVLAVDVGALLVNRRAAQNAADAGALAGARILCGEGGLGKESTIKDTAEDYVEDNNAVVEDRDKDIVINYVSPTNPGDIFGLARGEVVVTAMVEHDSFFSKIFKNNLLTARATAGAGCFPYRSEIVLPIAWSCRPPVYGSPEGSECDIYKVNYETVKTTIGNRMPFPLPHGTTIDPIKAAEVNTALYGVYSDRIYIVMDSDVDCMTKQEIAACDAVPPTSGCPTDKLRCDWVQDGIDRDQLQSSSNRGWLNLDPYNKATQCSGGGADLIECWIKVGLESRLEPHTWLTGVEGGKTKIYEAISDRRFEIVWVPVFDLPVCEDASPTKKPDCIGWVHDGLDNPPIDKINTTNDNKDSYHIIAFAPFMITCIDQGNGNHCPGRNAAEAINPDIPGFLQWNSIKTIEGYFIDPKTLGEEVSYGADLGIYTVSLTR